MRLTPKELLDELAGTWANDGLPKLGLTGWNELYGALMESVNENTRLRDALNQIWEEAEEYSDISNICEAVLMKGTSDG